MSCKAQLPLANTAPLKIGNFFTDAFALPGTPVIGGPSTGGTLEIWVIETAGEKYEMAGYWYQDLTLKKASAIIFTPPA
jgi:hypothetical protein